jgi:hypothetical protein
MRVRAIAPGFFDIQGNGHPVDIKVGQVFEYPDNRKPGKWFVEVKADAVSQIPAAPAEPKHGPKAKSEVPK